MSEIQGSEDWTFINSTQNIKDNKQGCQSVMSQEDEKVQESGKISKKKFNWGQITTDLSSQVNLSWSLHQTPLSSNQFSRKISFQRNSFDFTKEKKLSCQEPTQLRKFSLKRDKTQSFKSSSTQNAKNAEEKAKDDQNKNHSQDTPKVPFSNRIQSINQKLQDSPLIIKSLKWDKSKSLQKNQQVLTRKQIYSIRVRDIRNREKLPVNQKKGEADSFLF